MRADDKPAESELSSSDSSSRAEAPARSADRKRDRKEAAVEQAGQASTVNDSWFINYNGIIVILPIIFNAFQDRHLERAYQRYSHGQRQKSLALSHGLDLALKLALLGLPLLLVAASGRLEPALIAEQPPPATNRSAGRALLLGPLSLSASGSASLGALEWLAEWAPVYKWSLLFGGLNAALGAICMCSSHTLLTRRLDKVALLTWALLEAQSWLLFGGRNALAAELAAGARRDEAPLAEMVSRLLMSVLRPIDRR